MEPPSRILLYSSVCAANLATFTCGLAMGWSSPVLPKLKGSGNYTIDDSPFDTFISETDESWLGSLVAAGAIFSPIIAGFLADKLGRKLTLQLTVVPFLIGYTCAIFAQNVYFFYVKQLLCGLTVGALYTVLPIYVTEVSDNEVRGSLGSLVQVFTTAGLLFSFLLAPFIDITIFNTVSLAVPVLFVVIFSFMPESPYFYVYMNRHEDAKLSLARLRAVPVDEVQNELSKIIIGVEETKRNNGSFMDIFRSYGLRKAFVISIALGTFQQFSGISAVLAYTQDIFAATGTPMSPIISSIIIGFVQFLAGFITPVLVDKLGRKLFLITSSFGTGVSHVALGYYFYQLDNGYDVKSISLIPLISLIIFIITYNVGYGPLPITIMGELFPSYVKSYASTSHVATCFFWSFIICRYFNDVASLIGKACTFWIFSVICFGAIFFISVYVPETKGRSIEEIQNVLNGQKKTKTKSISLTSIINT